MDNRPGLDGWTVQISGHSDTGQTNDIAWISADKSGTQFGRRKDKGRDQFVIRSHGASALICPTRQLVRIFDPSDQHSDAEIRSFIRDVVAPRVLSYQGHFVLHAAAFEVNAKALALAAPTGYGKSTLVGSFHRNGWPILGDDALDITGLDSVIHGAAVYRRLHLCRDSFDYLFCDQRADPPVGEGDRKIKIPLSEPDQQDNRSRPISALVFLAPPPDRDSIRLEPLSQSATCLELIANSFSLHPMDTGKAVERMRQATMIAQNVAGFRLSFPRDYSSLEGVRDVLLSLATDQEQSNNELLLT